MLQVVVWQVHAGLAADRKAAGNLRRRSIDVDLGDHWPLAHIFGHDRQIEPEVEALLRLVGRSREVEALPAAGAQQPLARPLPSGLPSGTGRRSAGVLRPPATIDHAHAPVGPNRRAPWRE